MSTFVKKNKKIVATVVTAAIIFALSITVIVLVTQSTKVEKLVIYNWADYIEPDVLTDFEDEYEQATGRKIKVIYSTFETNETMITEIMKGDSQIDLVCPSEYAIQKLLVAGKLNKLNMDESDYSNLVNVEPAIHEKIGEVFGNIEVDGSSVSMLDYFVPYMWGTLGILYNADKVTEDDLAAGWGLLWNAANNPALEGKILMKDSVRDVYAAAITYLIENNLLPAEYEGKSIEELINTVDDTLLNAVESVLRTQRDHLKGYEVDFGKDDMIRGVAYVDLAWSGDALWAIEEGELEGVNLDYFVPQTGGNLWFDGWVIPTSAKNTDAAKMFIDYLCRPDIAMRNAMEIGYTSAVSPDAFLDENNPYSVEAIDYLIECEYEVSDYFEDERRYPVFDETLGVMRDFGATNEEVVAMWERVKGDDPFPLTLVWLLLGIVGATALLYAAFVVARNIRLKRISIPVSTNAA